MHTHTDRPTHTPHTALVHAIFPAAISTLSYRGLRWLSLPSNSLYWRVSCTYDASPSYHIASCQTITALAQIPHSLLPPLPTPLPNPTQHLYLLTLPSYPLGTPSSFPPYVSLSTLRPPQLSLGPPVTRSFPLQPPPTPPPYLPPTFLSTCTKYLSPLLSPRPALSRIMCNLPPPGGLLIHGQASSGRSTLAQALADHVRSDTAYFNQTIYIPCASLRGQKMGQVLSELRSAFVRAR